MGQAVGLEQNLFTSVGAVQEEDGATTITADVSGHYYAYVGDTGVNTLKMESEAGSKSFSQVKYHYICDLGWHDAGDVISLTSEDSSSLNVSAYRLNFDVMDQVISILGEQTMTVDSYSSTHINGHIDVSRAGELILSVAYEPGWPILVHGAEVRPALSASTFPCLPLTAAGQTISLPLRPGLPPEGIIPRLICFLGASPLLPLDPRATVPAATQSSPIHTPRPSSHHP